MKRLIIACLMLLLAFAGIAATQNETGPKNNPDATTPPPKKHNPIFRANKDQIKQAQALLKQRGYYNGEQTGKLDPETRAGLKKYQEAEKIKVTGTLNRMTLEKMSIQLTEKQKAI